MNIIEKYNPINANQLSSEDIAKMQDFTDEEIKALAKAYPNKNMTGAYLVLFDENVKNQIYPLSTWQNLANLRKFGKNNYKAYTFRSLLKKSEPITGSGAVQAKVIDLTNDELEELAGLKSIDAVEEDSVKESSVEESSVEETKEPVKELDVSKLTVSALKGKVEEITDVEVLNQIKLDEEKGENRTGVIKAIEKQIEKLNQDA